MKDPPLNVCEIAVAFLDAPSLSQNVSGKSPEVPFLLPPSFDESTQHPHFGAWEGGVCAGDEGAAHHRGKATRPPLDCGEGPGLEVRSPGLPSSVI